MLSKPSVNTNVRCKKRKNKISNSTCRAQYGNIGNTNPILAGTKNVNWPPVPTCYEPRPWKLLLAHLLVPSEVQNPNKLSATHGSSYIPCPTCLYNDDNDGAVRPSTPHTLCLDNSFCPARRRFQHQRNLLQSDQDLLCGIWTYGPHGHESQHAAKTQLCHALVYLQPWQSKSQKTKEASTNTFRIWHWFLPKYQTKNVLPVWCVCVCVCVADTPRKVYIANCTCFSCHRKMETQLHVTHPPGTQPLAIVSFVLEIWTPKSLSERFKQRYLHSSTLTWKLGAYLARFNLEVRFQRIPHEHQGRKKSQCWDMFDHPDTE